MGERRVSEYRPVRVLPGISTHGTTNDVVLNPPNPSPMMVISLCVRGAIWLTHGVMMSQQQPQTSVPPIAAAILRQLAELSARQQQLHPQLAKCLLWLPPQAPTGR